MKSVKLYVKLVLMVALIPVLLFEISCSVSRNPNNSLGSIVSPYRFNLVGWEFNTIVGDLKKPYKASNVSDESGTVIKYFSLVQQISLLKSQMEDSNNAQQTSTSLKDEIDKLDTQKTGLKSSTESILSKQIMGVLVEQGIYNPFYNYVKLKISFPGMYFKLQEPPGLLVISPRNKIEKTGSVLLNQDTTLQEDKDIESKVDKLGVSSLVVPLGGIATYPSFVADGYGLKSAVDTIAHEWVHQYLTFKPLGFVYLLDTMGISHNSEDATIDETVADIVGQEICTMVLKQYYPAIDTGSLSSNSGSDYFNQQMREIRQTVDEYLAQGQVDQSEQYMEAQRQYLASKGYYVRKLNQAYFAFYNTYADNPAYISETGTELKELRSESISLKGFLDIVSTITNSQSLQATLSKN